MRRNQIQENWNSYRQKVMPKSAHADQIQECRRAFYAGAQAALGVYIGIGDDSVSEDGGVKILEDLRDELAEFPKHVLEGME